MPQILIIFRFFAFLFDSCTNSRCFPLNFRQRQRVHVNFCVYFCRLVPEEQMQATDFLTQFVVFLHFFLEIRKNLC